MEFSEARLTSGLTEEQEREVDEVKERRARFRFANYGIPLGSIVTFTRDPSISAVVVENDKISINGRVESLSTFAKELLGYQRRPQGTLYFKFEDEILDDRRRRIDGEG